MIRNVTVSVSMYHPDEALPVAVAMGDEATPIDVSDKPAEAAAGPGLAILIPILVEVALAWLKKRGLLAVGAVVMLLLTAGDASAQCRGGRGGPLRNLVGRVADRFEARRGVAQYQQAPLAASAGGCANCPSCTEPGVSFQIQPVGSATQASPCPNGVCPVPAPLAAPASRSCTPVYDRFGRIVGYQCR